MTDTNNLDTTEKVDILIKQSFGFPSTTENKQWYEETSVKFNNYLNGEELFLDTIPNIPDFDINGTVRNPEDINLFQSDFINFSNDPLNKSLCSIVDDSTGTIRRFKLMVLQQTPQLGDDAGASWYKLDALNNNIINNAFQFNYKQYKDAQGNVVQPYLYGLYTQKSSDQVLPFGRSGGNWNYDIKSGIIFFPDFNNFSNGTQTQTKFQINTSDNFPVLTFYKYIGRKGINLLTTMINDISNNNTQSTSDTSFSIFEASFNQFGGFDALYEISNNLNTYFDFNDTLTIKKDLYVSQNLYVDGSFTYINSDVHTITDPLVVLGSDLSNTLTFNDGQDRGLQLVYYDNSSNSQKSAFMGLINQDHSDYNKFVFYNDSSINNNNIDISNSSLAILKASLFEGDISSQNINTNYLNLYNDLSIQTIYNLDNSSSYILNLNQINSLLDDKSFLTKSDFNTFLDTSFVTLITDVSNLDTSLVTLTSYVNTLDTSLVTLTTDVSNLDTSLVTLTSYLNALDSSYSYIVNDISSLYQILDNSYSHLFNDISSIYSLINDLSNGQINIDFSLNPQVLDDVSKNKLNISNILNEIILLKSQDLLFKADINFNSSLINLNNDNFTNLINSNFIEISKNTTSINQLNNRIDSLQNFDSSNIETIISKNKNDILVNSLDISNIYNFIDNSLTLLINNLDNSLVIFNSNVTNLDNSLVILNSNVTNLDNSLVILTENFNTLDNSYYIFESSFNQYGGFDALYEISNNLDKYFGFNDTLTIKKDLYVSENLYIDGSFTYINTDVHTITDPLIVLGSDLSNPLIFNDGQDRGLQLVYYDNSSNNQKSAFMGLINQDHSDYNKFVFYNDSSINNNNIDISNSILAILKASLFEGDISSQNINTNYIKLYNDLSIQTIYNLDNSSSYVLNLNQINSLLDDKSYLTKNDFNTFLDTSFTTLINDVSNLDTSFTTLINDVSNLYTSLVTLTTDVSNLDTSLVTLTSYVNTLDTSLVTLTTDVNNLDTSFVILNSDVNKLDTSLVLINQNVDNLDTSLVTLTSNLHKLDTSFIILTSDVNKLDSSLVLINQNVDNLDTSLVKLTSDVTNLDISLVTLTSDVNKLDTSLVTLTSDVNKIDTSLVTLTSDVNKLDTSFLILTSDVNILDTSLVLINQTVDNFDTSLVSINNRIDNLELIDISNIAHILTNQIDISYLYNFIDNSFSLITNKLDNLDNSLVLIDQIVDNLDTSLVSINQTVNNLDTSLLSINQTVNNLDTSLVSINQNVNNLDTSLVSINQSVDKLDTSYTVVNSDINNLYDIINNSLQTLSPNDSKEIYNNIIQIIQNNLLAKEDINFNASVINYNTGKINSIENIIYEIEYRLQQKFDNLNTKLIKAFDFLDI